MPKTLAFLICFIAAFISSFGQEPKYTPKHFVSVFDTSEFKATIPAKNGLLRTYLLTSPDVWDTDDNNTTHVRRAGPALLCVEGLIKNGKRNDVFKVYLIDSLDHLKRYKIWEQTYVDDKLNGEWRTFNLKGTMIAVQNFKDDSLNGIYRQYWIDGKRIMEEKEYFNGSNKFIEREFDDLGRLQRELMIDNGVLNGPSRRYYENGTVKEEVFFLNGHFDKTRKYFFPSGKLWTEMEYKNGKPWTVISNLDEQGNKRNPGTLKNGNGTLILYNQDGTVRETLTYKNGEQQ